MNAVVTHPTARARFEAVMQTLRHLGYEAPAAPWGITPQAGYDRLPPEARHQYAFATEANFHRAFACPPTLPPEPLYLHWQGEGTTIARAFHEAGFFVRWQGTPASPLQVGIHPFENTKCPIWTPDAWSHLMSILRLLESYGYAAPQTPTISMDADTLPPTRVTFGILEQTIARFGTLQTTTSTTQLKAPLFLTWQGTPTDGIRIATTFHREGCQVWWRQAPNALMGVAPTASNLTVKSPHFPPWTPPTS